jgi:hypothetical protein
VSCGGLGCRDRADGNIRGDGICHDVRVCCFCRGAAFDGRGTAGDGLHGGDIDCRGGIFLARGARTFGGRRRNDDAARTETAGRGGSGNRVDGRRGDASGYRLVDHHGLVLDRDIVRQGVGKSHRKESANSKE